MHYLIGFTTYTLAMLGIIFLGFVVAKKCVSFGISRAKNNFLSMESSLSLEPRKNLYIVKAGRERFLVSTDTNGSNLISKLEDDNIPENFVQKAEKEDRGFNIVSNMPLRSIETTSISGVSDLPDTYLVNRVLKKLNLNDQNMLG